VESAAALALLQQMGADQAQGFHLSRPLPAAALAGFVARWSEAHGLALPAQAHGNAAVAALQAG
jgi:sensor c-di-GMP phosphodiesterase-like protein